MKWIVRLLYLSMLAAGCGVTTGGPVDFQELGYRSCQGYFDCGFGRYCSSEGLCWADCRNSADCARLGPDMICNRFGQCLLQEEERSCTRHEDCGAGRYCNGVCSMSGALCGSQDECPLPASEECQGTCSAHCGNENDCRQDLECTPVGQCLLEGWEKWIPPGEMPPAKCKIDAQCKTLGWRWICDCDKAPHPYWGEACPGGQESVCIEDPNPLDFGDGPADSPAHGMTGIWGMRTQAASVLIGLPVIHTQNTYMSSLALVKVTHTEGDTVKIESRECDIQLINFNDDDTPPDNLGWMVVPHDYLHSLFIRTQWAEVTSAEPGSSVDVSVMLEVRGARLEDPMNDPVPTQYDYQQNPDDPRFWDQDEDGHVGITMLQDGMMRGEIYHIQRIKAYPEGIRIDDDHVRGLINVNIEMEYLDTSNQNLMCDLEFLMHDQANRTFFRQMRMPDDTSCADLIREGSHDDSWLRHSNHMMDVPDP